MKKIFLLLLSLSFLLSGIAQQNDAAISKALVSKHSKAIGLSQKNLENYILSSSYNADGIQYVYLVQSFKGLPVRNQMKVLSFKEGQLSSNAGAFIEDIESLATTQSSSPAIKATDAVNAAFAEAKLASQSLNANTGTNNKFDFGQPINVTEKVTGELMWMPVEVAGKIQSVHLIWTVIVAPKGTDDMWQIWVDANTAKILGKQNLTVYESSDKKASTVEKKTSERNLLFLSKNESSVKFDNTINAASPAAVAGASYLVIPYPAESPAHPGGTPAVVTNPWAAAPGLATTFGWHSNGTTDYTISRGNNVWATEDQAATNQNVGPAAVSTTAPDPLTFNFPPDFTIDPRNTAFQQFAVTNLFYWNNVIHDITYQYGFTEPAGNFQANNQSNGGNGNDDVLALAQSGAAGSIGNNANFATPADGGRGRMRMYLFNAVSSILLRVNTPAAIVGDYAAVESGFSTANLLGNVGPKTGQVVWFNDDATGTTHFACGAPTNSLTGKIALISRGFGGATCTSAVNFTTKVLAAQSAGAIAVIMVNNVAGAPIVMGGTDNTITIPALMISQADGAILAAQITNNLNVTMSGTAGVVLDGDLDNGVVVHEYGHGISNRLTGGPANSNCLGHAEEGGEGWSDYMGLMLTTNWSTTSLTAGPTPRGVGNYVVGANPTTGGGIRNFPYSTNLAVNPLTYANMGTGTIGTEVHNIGEIWCAAVWEMTWAIIQQEGVINPNLYNFSSTTTGGNSIALKLVLEGMKLQPCSPGYVDARNAILAADRNLYCGRHACAIWTAFAKRGLGFGANQGSSFSATDQTASTTLPPAPSIATQPVDVSVAPGANATFSANAGADVNLIYQWQVSTDAGATWTDINCAISSTLTLNSVTNAMNGNKYRVNVFIGCAITTTNVATLNVSSPNPPTIVTQPVATSACVGSSATFTSTASGASTYAWQVSTNAGATWAAVVPAATTTTLTLTSVTLGMSTNLYRMIATNTAGSTPSNAAMLTVTSALSPVITSQPSNQIACAGSGATFAVTSSTAGVTYSWEVSTNAGATWAAISPAVTTATLNISAVTTAMNNNQYRVVITGGCPATNTTISSAGTLTVNVNTLSITTQPTSVTTCASTNASFTIAALTSGLTYSWQVSTNGGTTWAALSPAVTTATLNLAGVTSAMNSNQYRCIVSSTASCSPAAGLASNAATLTVQNAPLITTQPSAVINCAGTSATFNAVATGANITYQWQSAASCTGTFIDIPAATSASYTIPTTTVAMNGTAYRVIVSGTCAPSATSNCVVLTVSSGITITTQPTSLINCVGTNATFAVVAAGATPVYQWQVSTNGGTTFTDIIGANATTLTLTSVTAAMNNNQYHLVVSNSCSASVTSANATLTVQSPPAITTQPIAVTTCSGTNTSFAVTATGTNLTYQWQTAPTCTGIFTNVAGPTGTLATLNLTGVTSNAAYRCTISGVCTPASVTSNCVTLTVNPLTTLTLQPVDATRCIGTPVTFTTAATGAGIAYKWQISTDAGATYNDIVPAETNATFTISAVTSAMASNKYRAVVTSTCTVATNTNAATLTVQSLPTITVQPVDINTCATTATFTVTATGTGIQHQWQVSTNGGVSYINLIGQNSNILTLTGLTATQGLFKYRDSVYTTSCGFAISNAVSAKIGITPVIILTAAPVVNFNPYTNGGLYTTVSPAGNYTYQWKRNNSVLTNTSSFITKTNGLLDEFGSYIVSVTDVATGCIGLSNTVSVSDIEATRDQLFISPNPTTGLVRVSFYTNTTTPQAYSINVYDDKGGRVVLKDVTLTGRYGSTNIDLTAFATGTYIVILKDASGKKVASNKVVKY
jgi:extracellular elastinolytic metalloproteinase